MKTTSAHIWLADELARRRSQNKQYSLRTLARKLELSPGRLSEFISGKRAITARQAEKIAERLGYAPEVKEKFLGTISGSPQGKRPTPQKANYRRLSSDTFHAIAEGCHIGMLCLMDTKGFKPEAEWIAQRLGVTTSQAKHTLERLTRLGLVQKQGESFIKTDKNLDTTTDIKSTALRASHKETLQQAAEALDEIAVEWRDITSMTMAIDPKKIAQAKKMIRSFRRRLCTVLESGEQSEVYNLNIQLVPVTKLNGGRNGSR